MKKGSGREKDDAILGVARFLYDKKSNHIFRCKKCLFVFRDNSKATHNDKCPACGNPKGGILGIRSGIKTNIITGNKQMCDLIHAEWEGIYGMCNCFGQEAF